MSSLAQLSIENEQLRAENAQLQRENLRLLKEISCYRSESREIVTPSSSETHANNISQTGPTINIADECQLTKQTLLLAEYVRYGRQLILPRFGLSAQVKLKSASVLLVGAGGLGAPCALYLAAAGVGRLGIVDYDVVEESNLHRQVIHSESKIGKSKAWSAREAIRSLNSSIECIAYESGIVRENAIEIAKSYDIIVDASDNVPTRYLLSDLACFLKIPLVSGAALRFEGQLTIYNYNGGPCYRCIFPKPPDSTQVVNCSDGGVLGAVPGVIGVMQALEVIKIVTGFGDVLSGKMLLFDASFDMFRVFKLRGRQDSCTVCINSSIESFYTFPNYEVFCGTKLNDKAVDTIEERLARENRITCKNLKQVFEDQKKHLLIDVREPVQFEICSLPNSINIPLRELKKRVHEIKDLRKSIDPEENAPIYFVCRRGIDSQIAVEDLLSVGNIQNILHIEGGIQRWHHHVDPSFPLY